jgi:hypothetical protein
VLHILTFMRFPHRLVVLREITLSSFPTGPTRKR